ncbi:MAG: ATP-dependent acyl-CoA ligase [Desulfobacterales bacterium]|nr:ATP-dependent acyl-CoA ligase [Desulfobacterales bacterium]
MTESKMPGILAFDMMAKAEENPDFEVVTFETRPSPDEVLTYADLVLKGNKLVQALKQNGIGAGDTFSFVMRNHPEMVIGMYAASALRAVMVPIDPRSRGRKLKFQMENSGSKGVVFASELMEPMEEALAELPQVKPIGVMYRDYFDIPVSSKYPDLGEILEGPEAPGIDIQGHTDDDFIMIIYTSGTTGDPKGVSQRANRLQAYGLLAQLVWQYTPEDRPYTGLSMTHGNALAVTLFPALNLSIPAVISRKFTKSRIWDICREYGCTTFSLLGGMMMGIYSEPQKPDDADNPVRKVISAGTPAGIWKPFEERFGVQIHEWYAAVEGGFAHNAPGDGPVGSFGKPLDGLIEMKIVREDDSECEPGETGELVSRAVGSETEVIYHGNQEASDAKTRGGWLRSGDIVHKGADGWYYFDYRKGGGLRRQGDFIMPEYVEGVLAEHPHVTDICVYGVKAASGAPGESDLVAAVVSPEGVEPDVQGLFNTCLKGLEPNSVPSFIQVVDEIPKTASEKNLDRLLKEDFNPDAPRVFRLEDYRQA